MHEMEKCKISAKLANRGGGVFLNLHPQGHLGQGFLQLLVLVLQGFDLSVGPFAF